MWSTSDREFIPCEKVVIRSERQGVREKDDDMNDLRIFRKLILPKGLLLNGRLPSQVTWVGKSTFLQ